MATPQTVMVTATVRNPDGSLYTGPVLFTQPVHLRHTDGTMIMPGTTTAEIVDGDLAVALFPVDDPAWLPQDWAYIVKLRRGSMWATYMYQPGVADLTDTLNDIIPLETILTPGETYALGNHTHPDLVTDAELAAAIAGVSGGAVTSVAGKTGVVTLVSADVGLGNVNNTADASKPVSTPQQTALNLKANLASPTFTGTVAGITAAMVGLGSVDNTPDTGKPVSTAQQTALNLKANLASPTFTGTVAGITAAMVGLGNVNNTADTAKPVSTPQQTALDLKANLASPTFTGTVAGITKSMVGLGNVDNTADASKVLAQSQITNLVTDLGLKAPLASPTFTGVPAAPTAAAATNTTQVATTAHVFAERTNTATLTNKTLTAPAISSPTGLVKADVGLANVDNTSDVLKPISAATLIGLAQAHRPTDHGLAGWMWPGDQVQGSFVLPTAGVGHVFRMRVFTTTVSAIGIHVVTPGSGLTANQCYATLHNDAGAILGTGAITADQSTAWASGGAKVMALAVGQGGLVPGDYYKVRLWYNGTTGPALSRAGSSNTVIINYNLSAPNFHYSTADTALTDVTSGTVTKATIGTMTGANVAMFCALHP